MMELLTTQQGDEMQTERIYIVFVEGKRIGVVLAADADRAEVAAILKYKLSSEKEKTLSVSLVKTA